MISVVPPGVGVGVGDGVGDGDGVGVGVAVGVGVGVGVGGAPHGPMFSVSPENTMDPVPPTGNASATIPSV